ncbi:MAG: penicillin-binding protein 1A [Rhodanobacteraceae bacterium]
MPRLKRIVRYLLILAVSGFILGAGALGIAYWLLSPRMPAVGALKNVQLQVPLRVLSSDGKLIATFGETRRIPAHIDQVPEQLKQAVLSAEDANFYSHPGFDWRGILRAVVHVALSGGKKTQGGSTITQQVARSFFLSPEKLYTRKLLEIFIAIRMEHHLSKDEILELYLNKMFMGHRSYGVAAAADYYYGKSLQQLSLAQCAMLASLFQLPSEVNPVTNHKRSVARRNWVLGQMLSNQFISKAQYKQAVAEPDHAFPHEPPTEVNAPYLAEMVRRAAINTLGNNALTDGYVVTTSINSERQHEARQAVRSQLIAYDHRHGYRGPLGHVQLDSQSSLASYAKALQSHDEIAGMVPALVTQVDKDAASLYIRGGETTVLGFNAVSWARPWLSPDSMGPKPKHVTDVLKAGDIVRLMRDDEGNWQLAEIPAAEAALVSLDPHDGAIQALVGGFSFARSKFNRAIDIARQPGSSFKPFLYSAALEHGFTAASIVNDAPLVIPDPTAPEGQWTPSNDDGKFSGPMRVRMALVQSKNLVSVRLLDAIGIHYAREYATRFGLPLDALPKSLSLALGTASVSPLTMARGYAVFANGGYLIRPWFISNITDRNGTRVFATHPVQACRDCQNEQAVVSPPQTDDAGGNDQPLLPLLPVAKTDSADTAVMGTAPRVIDAGNAFIMDSMMRDVIRRGTGRRALVLKRPDLAGKTGTTNDHRDAWFSGFNARLVTTAWVGFDDFSSLGKGEFGSRAALPIWIDYMGAALGNSKPALLPRPDSVVTAKINPGTGLIASPDDPTAVGEYFRKDALQRLQARSPSPDEPKKKKNAYDIF